MSTPSTQHHQAFTSLLQQETTAVKHLLEAIQQEQQALGARDASVVAAAVADKERLLGQLDGLAHQRAELLQQAGLAADKLGFQKLLEGDDSGQLAGLWSELEALLKECQKQNQINGTLLESGRQTAQQILSILTGREMGQNELYNQRGETSASLGQNTSIKA